MTSNLRERNKKKPYQEPNLRVYGDVRALTRSTTNIMAMHDNSAKQNKTN